MPNFSQSLPMVLNYTLDSILPPYRELFSRYDCTEQQWRVLRVLWDLKQTTAAEVSRLTLLPAPSLVGILDRLEKKELISRIRSLEDRRHVHIVATSKGRKMQAEVMPIVARIHTFIEESVSTADWVEMEKTLSKISTRLNAASLDEILNQDPTTNLESATI